MRYYLSIYLEGLWKTIKDPSLNMLSLHRDLNIIMSFPKAPLWNFHKKIKKAM